MPTHRKNLYELIEYPKNVKKRGKPALTAPVGGPARISKLHCASDNQELPDDSDSSRRERQICDIERRPESQANVIGYAASHGAFDGIAERAAKEQTYENRRRWNQCADDNQRNS